MTKYISNVTLCPKCHHSFPLLFFNENNSDEVLIQCDNCGLDEKYSIHNYLHQMKISTIKDIDKEDKEYCFEHNRDFIKYCIQCDEYLCNKCEKHELHKCISLDMISTTDLTDKIKLGYNHIDIYCNDLKSTIINNYIHKLVVRFYNG